MTAERVPDYRTPRIRPARYQSRHVPTPHEDATRREPEDGNREQTIRALLKAAFRGPYQGALTTHEETATGRALADRFVDRLDTEFWFCYGVLSDEVRRLLWLQFGPDDRTLDEAARATGMSRRTAYRRRHQALEFLCRIFWDDPGYVLPTRTETSTAALAIIHYELSEIEWE